MPVVNVLTLKKETVPKSDKHSIDTSAKPAIIAGLAEGKIILKKVFLRKDLNFFLPLYNYLIGSEMKLLSKRKHMGKVKRYR